jgi:hypothetical protein
VIMSASLNGYARSEPTRKSWFDGV